MYQQSREIRVEKRRHKRCVSALNGGVLRIIHNHPIVLNTELIQKQEKQEKQAMEVKNKREMIQTQLRLKRSKYIQKWEQYRHQKLHAVAGFVDQIKLKKLVKTWNDLILSHRAVHQICHNLKEIEEIRITEFATRFLAIKFKVRLFNKYTRELGGGVCFRETNRARQKLTLLGQTSYPAKYA